MTSRKWIDIQKREDFVGFEELEGGDVAFDDLAEDASCGGHIFRVAGNNCWGWGGGSEVR